MALVQAETSTENPDIKIFKPGQETYVTVPVNPELRSGILNGEMNNVPVLDFYYPEKPTDVRRLVMFRGHSNTGKPQIGLQVMDATLKAPGSFDVEQVYEHGSEESTNSRIMISADRGIVEGSLTVELTDSKLFISGKTKNQIMVKQLVVGVK